MFRTKSMYVIWIILLASALLTSFLSKIDYDAVNKEWERQQAVESQADTDGQTVDVVNAQDIEEQQADNSNKEQLSQCQYWYECGITYGAREEGYGNGCFLF